MVASRYAELAVGASQVHLDRAASEEQCLGDLAVAEAVGGHPRDPALLHGERVGTAQDGAPRARAGGLQLDDRPVGLDDRPAPVGELQSLAERLAGVAPVAASSQGGA